MPSEDTSIRLIDVRDADAVAAHLARDVQEFAFHKQGHSRRAVGLVLQVMAEELELHWAEASTQMENLPSQRVLRSNGFASFGIAHSHVFVGGAWRDGVLWERILDE
ncbi:MAG: GNAT family N-acetyltransferase [Nocardioidaceae bacterium]